MNKEQEGARRSGAVEATVTELLPNAAYRVRLDNQSYVVAHAAPPSEVNFVRLRLNDRVLVELSPLDRTRGRIVRLLQKG